MKARSSALVASILAACAAADARAASARMEPLWAWANASASPAPIDDAAMSDRDAELLAHCGAGESGLREVATRIALRKAARLEYLDMDGLAFAQRAAGEPHVWPRAWVVAGRALDHEATLRKLDAWRASFHDLGERRCGVATAFAEDGTQIIAAVAVDALADLAPLPVRARTGAWLEVTARLEVKASGARVVVQGPGTPPRTVPTSMRGDRVHARFALDRPGAFTVQVVAEVATGPRPVLEASVFADVEPPVSMPSRTAPGEEAALDLDDEPLALTRMLAALRTSERAPPLTRDARLDALALAHTRAMIRARAVGHDVGEGDPSLRLERAGLRARLVAENVAHAQSVALAHRALYASPSHRANLVRADVDRVGIAVLDDADGSVWVTEVFASALR